MYVEPTSVFFLILTEFLFVFTSSSAQEGEGQKAHFSLKDTPGSFNVQATKVLAKVSSKPDSIKVIVKPGTAEIPVPQLPTQKPLVHVVSPAVVKPVGGWNFMSFGKKRSRIGGRTVVANNTGKAHKHRNLFTRNILGRLGKHSGSSAIRKAIEKLEENDKKFEKTDLSKAFRGKTVGIKSFVKPTIFYRQAGFKTPNANLGIAKRFEQTPERPHSHMNSRRAGKVKGTSHVKPGQKRELVERKMQVHGGTGKFTAHVDKKLTNVSSSTGGVQVFIKNPSPEQISQLPPKMLQLSDTLIELPSGMPQLPAPLTQFTRGISPLPKEKPWVLARLPHDWTGASNWEES